MTHIEGHILRSRFATYLAASAIVVCMVWAVFMQNGDSDAMWMWLTAAVLTLWLIGATVLNSTRAPQPATLMLYDVAHPAVPAAGAALPV